MLNLKWLKKLDRILQESITQKKEAEYPPPFDFRRKINIYIDPFYKDLQLEHQYTELDFQ